ncbi:MAG: small multi-drug export protein [Oscillospiraceae bacterium]|nr:small multi-drug export protein [Oscillospiraceae bacterium]
MKYLLTFLLSMVPVIELRGSIPFAILNGINPWLAFAISVVGNTCPVILILLFIRRVFAWAKKYERLGKIVLKLERKAAGKSDKVRKYEFFGLCLFVAIPLPGTGAWTGALIAAFVDMRIRRALPAIFIGMIVAGVIITLICALGIHALDFFLG